MDKENRTEKILVVDDTPSSINILSGILEGEGYQVFVATSGERAIKRAEQTAPDLILLDVLMPGLDGFDTCRRLKSGEKTGERPVIFMTALTTTEDKVTGFDAGGVDYVTKPIEIEEVLARIKTHLALRNMQQQLETQNRRLQREVTERNRVEKEVMKSKYGVFGYIDEDGAFVCPSMTRDIWDQCRVPDKDIVFPREK